MVMRKVMCYLTIGYCVSTVSLSNADPPQTIAELESIALDSSREKYRLTNSQLLYEAYRETHDGTPLPKIDVRVIDAAEVESFEFRYPEIKDGMILPLFGYPCQVKKVVSDKQFDTRLELTVLKDDWREKQYGDDLAIPLNGGIQRTQANPFGPKEDRWTDTRYFLRLRSFKKENGRCVAELEVGTIDREKAGGCFEGRRGQIKTRVLAMGDTFVVPASLCVDEKGKSETLLSETKFLVSGIVEPDAAQHVLGWITVRPLVKTWPQPKEK